MKEMISDQERALLTKGISSTINYQAIARTLKSCALSKDAVLLDVGCGQGNLWEVLQPYFAHYVGIDVARYPGFPKEAEFIAHNLAQGSIPLRNDFAEVVVACEVTPSLENPRAFFRELVRLAKPGGWIVVTNPNQLSFLSIMTLITRQRFNAFQDLTYPWALTPLLEIDLIRMAKENKLIDANIFYTHHGRIPFTKRYYPSSLTQLFPRAFSDNLGIVARKLPA